MASTSTRPATRTVRVHGTELSTDREMFGPYAETMAALVALVAVLAAAWVVAAPPESADLPAPVADTEPTAPEVYDVRRTSSSTTDVLWPDAFDAPAATAVTVVPVAAPVEEPIDATAPVIG